MAGELGDLLAVAVESMQNPGLRGAVSPVMCQDVVGSMDGVKDKRFVYFLRKEYVAVQGVLLLWQRVGAQSVNACFADGNDIGV
jgi:hypothetical protein